MGFLLLTGFSVFSSIYIPILALLLVPAGFGLWIARPFTRDHAHSSLLSITLSIPLGTIALSFLFFGFIALARLYPLALTLGAWIIALGGFGLLVFWIVTHGRELIHEVKWLPLAGGVAAFLVLLFLRLAFLRGLLAPPYADSAWHYLLSTRLLDPSIPLNLVTAGSYYHRGFHVLAAWLAALTQSDLLSILPLLGQVMLAILPLSVYALTLSVAGESNAARISALSAALLWSMPAFAANWGKYPAIAGIVLLPAVIAAFFLLFRHKSKNIILILIMIVLLVGLTWFHTRILVLFLCAGAAALVSVLLLKRSSTLWLRIFGLVILIVCAILYLTTPSLHAIYNGNHHLPIVGLLILLPFALLHQPRITSAIEIFTLLLLVCSLIPLPAWLHLPAASLLDEQFLVMSVFLPFSLIIGVGGSGLLNLFKQNWHKVIVWLIFTVWIFTGSINPKVYTPDPCCNFVTDSDVLALDWMKTTLPPGATVFIAGIDKVDGLIGSDAGVWVTPLTGYSSPLLPFDYAWFSGQMHAEICALSPAYMFAGHQPYSFQINAITHPDWYELVLDHPGTSVYRIIPCQP